MYQIEVQAHILILIPQISLMHNLYFTLLVPARLFSPALLFGTLEYILRCPIYFSETEKIELISASLNYKPILITNPEKQLPLQVRYSNL